MFEAYVLVCVIGNANVCHTLSDLEGPYKTRQECIARTYEIAVNLPLYMPNYEALKYKCFENNEDAEGKVRT